MCVCALYIRYILTSIGGILEWLGNARMSNAVEFGFKMASVKDLRMPNTPSKNACQLDVNPD